MLTDKRIKEVEENVRSYIEEGLLRKAKFDKNIFRILRRNATESLEVAIHLYKHKKSALWIIVASYYSMFYAANALIYKLGYKVGSKIPHKVTADALIAIARQRISHYLVEEYEDAASEALAIMKADELVSYFDYERKKRSYIQYETPETVKMSRAETSLNRAKEFVFQINKILED